MRQLALHLHGRLQLGIGFRQFGSGSGDVGVLDVADFGLQLDVVIAGVSAGALKLILQVAVEGSDCY
jgi:hypothetical protein